jgi:ribose transport system substrate-binding protein
MSHELITPLNSILGFSQLLQYDNEKEDKLLYAKSIIRSGKYLLNLINDTLDYNTINAGVLLISPEIVNAFAIIFEIFLDMQVLAQDNNITMELKCDQYKHINIFVDRQRYKQIIINLISNAIKYNKKSGNIEIIGRIKNNLFFIDVKDTGIGISIENFKKIGIPFERFGNKMSKIPGTGLGLSITKIITEIMNGIFEIKSIIGEGSIFSVGFNMSESTTINEQLTCHKQNEVNIDELCINRNYKGKICYIEDNEFNLLLMDKIINKYFINANYSFLQNGKDGFTVMYENTPDILLLDLNISDIDGIEILRSIKNTSKFANIKIIVISADISKNIEKKCLNLGANYYMPKPLIIPDFISLMNKIINN